MFTSFLAAAVEEKIGWFQTQPRRGQVEFKCFNLNQQSSKKERKIFFHKISRWRVYKAGQRRERSVQHR
jgi:hypothetical protein